MTDVKDAFSDVLPVIEKYAPTFGTIIGGPIGALVNVAVPLLSKAFQGNESNLPELASKIKQDDQAHEKLQCLENHHNEWIQILFNIMNELSHSNISLTIKLHSA